VWNNLHITADIIFRTTMTHEVISLRGQLDLQCQALRHNKRTQLKVGTTYTVRVNIRSETKDASIQVQSSWRDGNLDWAKR
jgi:hypothetical protein